MIGVMNEQLRKLLGISIAYGGDGDASGDATGEADEAAADAYAADALDALGQGDPSLAQTDATDALNEDEAAVQADLDAAPFGGLIGAPSPADQLTNQSAYNSLAADPDH